ncbi:MAG: biopolymer transporter ExbD [Acidobacteria bacterium CG_4_9_14_3_um_filter_49_7]|nr:MAG: biopolymer transporter ExbD [Acidobacteria bacterium CG_4_9_14_3_um_filter_49_7]
MNFGNGRSKRRNALLDISPLIDVVFLLLIFFMVSTTFRDEAGLPLNLPSSVSRGLKKTDNVVVTISKKGDIYVGKALTAPGKLTEVIRSQIALAKKKEVVIKADKSARYELVYRVMDASRQAGVEALSVAGEMKR